MIAFSAYVITNTSNGKKYIGATTNLKVRWQWHKAVVVGSGAAWRRSPLHHAMREEGLENFTFEHVACCPSRDDLYATEIMLIAQHNSRVEGGHGYNVSLGGKGTLGVTHEVSADGKARLRAAHLGRVHTDEHKAKLAAIRATPEWKAKASAAHIGQEVPENHPFRNGVWQGRKHTAETRAKMSAAAKAIAAQPEFQQRFEKTRGVPRSDEIKQRMRDGWARKAERDRARAERE